MAYTNSPLVTYTKLSPNNSGLRKHSIDRITPHCVVGQCSVETLGQIFLPTSRQASSNYGIGADGRIGMYVEEKNRSWCTSSSANDNRAVTIECASDKSEPYAFRDVVYNRLIELCIDICKRNGKKKLLWISDKEKALAYEPKSDEMLLTVHRWYAKKSCPGNWLMARMDDLATKVTKGLGTNVDNIVAPTNDVSIGTYRIEASALNIRKGPNTSYSIVGTYKRNDLVEIAELKGSWGRVKNTTNWICIKDYATKLSETSSTGNQTGSTTNSNPSVPYTIKKTCKDPLNIRKGPGVQYGINGSIKDYNVYTIVEVKNGWGRLKSGIGWICLAYTKATK